MNLDPARVREALGSRPVRVYPALVSTDADAQAWARSGAPEGAVVVSSYQASPRGRGGLIWTVDPERDLVFSVVARPQLPDSREGWLYVASLVGLSDVVGGGASVAWPDEVRRDGEPAAAIGWHVELGPGRVAWAVLTVWWRGVDEPATTLARIVERVGARLADDPADVLEVARKRCETLGRRVRALLVPLGPAGPKVEGTAADLLDDGALLLHTAAGGRIPVTPQGLGRLEKVED